MATYSYGQTRYNNLLNQFNNPNMSQEDLEAFNIGQSLGDIGKAFAGKSADGKIGDSIVGGVADTDAANMDAIKNLGSSVNITGDLGKGELDMKKLLELARQGNI